MKGLGQRLARAASAILGLGLACFIQFACAPPVPTTDDLRSTLDGKRYVGPAFAGLEVAGPCTLSSDFIPLIQCGTPPDARRLLDLDRRLMAQLGRPPLPARLRASAVARLATEPDADQLRKAVALLSEAVRVEQDPRNLATLFEDLSGAHLLMAEAEQSALELGAAIDAASRALELEPLSSAARFNRKLGLILLGVERADPGVDEALLVDIDRTVYSTTHAGTEPVAGCPTAQELRLRIDAWSSDPGRDELSAETTSPDASVLADCLATIPDRWLPDLMESAETDPRAVSLQWRTYREAQQALREFREVNLQDRLAQLQRLPLVPSLRIASDYLQAMQFYMASDYSAAADLLVDQAQRAAQHGYCEQAAISMHALALIAGIGSRYGEAAERTRLGLEWAERGGAQELASMLRTEQVEQLALSGHEEAAWRALASAMRSLDLEGEPRRRSLALAAAARLAQERSFDRAALHFYDVSVALREELPAAGQVEALLNRAIFQLELGLRAEAESAYRTAQSIVESAGDGMMAATHVQATLDLFEGLLGPEPQVRHAALGRAEVAFREAGNLRRAVGVRLELARAESAQGNRDQATETLHSAFDELARQTAEARSWQLSTALVAEARPVVDELLGLLLDDSAFDAIPPVLARYFGLRSHQQASDLALPAGVVRLTTFVRARELLLVLQAEDDLQVLRVPNDRTQLDELRGLLYLQLAAGLPRNHLETTLAEISRRVVQPIDDRWFDAEQWVVVADDILAGLPFHLLPLPAHVARGDDLILLDLLAVSYATDLRPLDDFTPPRKMISVGFDGSGSVLPRLRYAEQEAKEVGGRYADSRVLTARGASPVALLDRLRETGTETGPIGLHVAGHFELNLKSPLDSTLVLEPIESQPERSGRLTLGRLLEVTPGLSLLFLSSCEGGSNLPPAAHGLHSLAQAFTASGIDQTVLSLWKLDDEIAAKIAIRFHELLATGAEPAGALRTAQLEQRHTHPGSWAAFALYR